MTWTWFDATDALLAREVLQRGVAAVFLVAFVSTVNQFPALLGERGLLAVPAFLRRVRFRQSPSLFHWRYSDRLLLIVAWGGTLVAATLVVGLPQLGPPWVPMVAFLLLWAGYLSIVNVGQTFTAFGWETLLLEAGFIVAFLGSREVPPPAPVLLFLCWLVFRLEFGAGMIKIRGGREWRDLTAMEFHHETQPMPGPFSWHAHRLPRWAHRVEVVGNHVVQLGVPWFLFAPQPVASIAAGLIILSQLWLIVTGNFAWLNWITVVLAFAAVSDTSLRAALPWLPSSGGAATDGSGSSPPWWTLLVLAVTAGLVLLSIRPLINLFSRRQLMNASFNRYHLVNAYGAFGTVTKVRRELIVEGTDAADLGDETGWREYGFRGKPGDPLRRPPQFAPYHLRLDWLLWFLALGVRDTAWFERYLERLLQGDRAALALLRENPFPDGPPRWIRVTVWRYRFTTGRERRETGAWWVRTRLGVLVEPMSLGE